MSKIISEIPNSIPEEYREKLIPFCKSMRGKKLYDGYFLSIAHYQVIIYRILYTKKNEKPDSYTIVGYNEIPDMVSHKMRPLNQWSTLQGVKVFDSIDELEPIARRNYEKEINQLKSIYSSLFKNSFSKEL